MRESGKRHEKLNEDVPSISGGVGTLSSTVVPTIGRILIGRLMRRH